MAKLRVYELAKELSMESKEVIRRLNKMGLDLKNHMSTVEDNFADALREMVKPGPRKAPVAPKDEVTGGTKGVGDVVSKGNRQDTGEQVRTPAQGNYQQNQGQDKRLRNGQYQGGQQDRPQGQGQGQGSRPYQGQPRSQGQNQSNRPYQGERPQQDRPQGQGQFGTPRPPYQGDRPTQDRPQGARPSQGQGQFGGQRPPYQGQDRPQGNRPYQDRPQGPRQGQGQGQFGGPRPPYQGDRPPQDRPQGGRPPQGQGQFGGPRPPFQGDRPPQNRPQGNRPPQGQGQFSGQRPPFQGDRPAQERPQGVRPGQGQSVPAKKPEAIVYDKSIKNARREKEKQFKEADKGKRTEWGADQDAIYQKNRFKKKGPAQKEFQTVVPKKVVIGESVTVQELARGMGKTAGELIKKLMDLGVFATINQEIDADTALLIAGDFGINVEVRVDKKMEMMDDVEDVETDTVERPPVVTVMGHVDHGKTSLLDAIRKANVIATEAGGITQHIGAYQVEIGEKKITFLDTPGHQAFTAMRARGAQVTDIAIVVVAADDGVMPQTVEAINHAKAAKVPIIIAVNKIDKPDANPDRVKQELTEYGLVAEEWGGDTIMVPVSAKAHIGIQQLLEMILLVAEVAELKANPDRAARGTVVEAELDKGRGPVATVLVQKGTLRVGDNLVTGSTFGKVRAMIDDKGRRIKSAGPSTPVAVLGLSDVPPPGEIFVAVQDEKDARHIANQNQIKKREIDLNKTAKVSLDDLFKRIEQGEVKDLNVIVKADVQGSIEALRQSLNNLSTNEVRVNIIHGGVGTITESDVMLATASNAIIIGFNVRPDANTRKAAENEKVDIRLYRVIYDAIDDIKAAMSGLLAPSYKEVVLGRAEVRAVFKVPKVGAIAGSYVLNGKITRQAEVRVIRDGIVIHEGSLESLKRFKDDVKEVVSGYECGIGINNFNDIKEGDVIEAFIMEEVKRQL